MAAPWLKTRPAGVLGRDALDGVAQPAAEDLARLGARDQVPALLAHDALEEGVLVGRHLAQQTALPRAEEHLAQVGLDHRLQARALDQGRRGLGSAAQVRHVEAVERLGGQAPRQLLCLVPPDLRERRVALPLDQLEGLTLDGVGRGPVAHEEQFG